jgi:hypothetical protein
MPLLEPEFLAPPEMNTDDDGNGQDGQERPHGKNNCRMKNIQPSTFNAQHPITRVRPSLNVER